MGEIPYRARAPRARRARPPTGAKPAAPAVMTAEVVGAVPLEDVLAVGTKVVWHSVVAVLVAAGDEAGAEAEETGAEEAGADGAGADVAGAEVTGAEEAGADEDLPPPFLTSSQSFWVAGRTLSAMSRLATELLPEPKDGRVSPRGT